VNTLVIDLIGAAALLLWALRMVRTGVSRSFGTKLRRALAVSTRNRVSAFATGLLTTLALQSSTATALMTVSFASRGLIATSMALAAVLGADVGTALVAKVLSFDFRWLSPLLIAAGFAIFAGSTRDRTKAFGRTLIGLGLMLLALRLLLTVSEPLRVSPVAAALFSALNAAPILGLIVAAALTLLGSSSLAVILFVSSLSSAHIVDGELAIAMVLGANIGGTFIPLLSVARAGPVSKRAPVGNILMRLSGAVLVLPFLGECAALLAQLTDDPARIVVDAHLAFNLGVAVICLPFVRPLSSVCDRLFPAPPSKESGPRYLDEASLETAPVALSCAARETLRIADRVDAMLEVSLKALKDGDTGLCGTIKTMDDEIDSLQEAVKLYLARLNATNLSEEESRRSLETISFAINLEHIGDILDKSLRELILKRVKHQLTFSAEGLAEIDDLHAKTRENLHLAESVFMSRNESLARKLVQEKVSVREIEQRSAGRHLERVRQGRVESLQTSALHLDIMRDLKRINAHITSVAYSVLADTGGLRDSRLNDAVRSAI
jgi:phosphate:Na+ symporter